MQIVTKMAKLDTDDFGPKGPPPEEKASKPNGTGGCSGGTTSFYEKGNRRGQIVDESDHGSHGKDVMGLGINGYSTFDNKRAVTQGPGNGHRGCDYLHNHPHTLRAMKTMSMVDDALWWGVWFFRVALAVIIISIIFGRAGEMSLLVWPF
jgi:hypothetical protein